MENKRRALGKGLEDLFNNEGLSFGEIEKEITETTPKSDIKEIKLIELRSNPYQPRKVFDEEKLNELALSIKEYGVIQPIIVKKSLIKGYEIVAGERRVKASRIAGKETIPAIVKDFTDDQMMQIALLENLQRENLNPIEEAEAYELLLNKLKVTQEKLGERLGKSRSHVTNMLGLLSLPKYVKEMIGEKSISMGHARVLSKIKDEEKLKYLADKIKTEGLSVRDVENYAREDKKEKNDKKIVEKNSLYNQFEMELEEKFGTKVKISSKKIMISFNNNKDLERIIDIIND